MGSENEDAKVTQDAQGDFDESDASLPDNDPKMDLDDTPGSGRDDDGGRDGKDPAPAEKESGDVLPDGFDDELVAAAVGAGFQRGDLSSFGSASNLRKALALFDRHLADMGRAARKQASGETTEGGPYAPASPRKVEAQEKKTSDDDEEVPELDEDLDASLRARDGYHDKRIRAAVDRIAKVETQLRNALSRVSERDTNEACDRLQRLARDLGPEWAEVYGDQDPRDVDPNTKVGKNWKETLDMMDAIDGQYRASGRRPPKMEDLWKRVVHSLHADKIESIAAAKLAKKVERTARSATIRGKSSSRDGNKHLDPESRVKANIAARLHALGIR